MKSGALTEWKLVVFSYQALSRDILMLEDYEQGRFLGMLLSFCGFPDEKQN
jgi:hypothetical protein